MKLLFIIQARMGSTRLPGKVLLPIGQRPVLAYLLERIGQSSYAKNIVVATSTQAADDVIEYTVREQGYECFRGSEADVLERFYQCAKKYSANHVVRITADCPLIDPDVVDDVIGHHLKTDSDYTSNTLERSYPDGLDVEVVRFEALHYAWLEATQPFDREHVLPFIWRQENRFQLANVRFSADYSQKRWTLDQKEDFVFIKEIFEELYPQNKQFRMHDVLVYLQVHPELEDINKKYTVK